jgi:hypothetical protein
MKILELKTWTSADVILWLIRLHAPRHTKSFWDEVYLPCLRDGDGSLMQQRVGGWCRRWKIGLDRRSCASKLLFYAFDSYWKECVLHQTLSPEEARFIAGMQGVQMHHFRWAIQRVLAGQRTTGTAASPGPMFGRRGKMPEDYKRVSPKAVRLAVRHVLTRAGLPPLGKRLPGRPKKVANGNGSSSEEAFASQRELEMGESQRFLKSIYLRLGLCYMTSKAVVLNRVP